MGDRLDARVAVRALADDVGLFSRHALPQPLREYQVEVARAVAASVIDGRGLTFTVLYPRQAGKNELSAQLEAYLLWLASGSGGSLVKAAPTFRPQIVHSMMRLEKMLQMPLTASSWSKHQGYIVQVGKATIFFFSAQPGSSIVGATASLLLEGDEAQDIDPQKWDRDLVPMAATGNATRVLYGTPWTDDTLLAREIAAAQELEKRDGHRRHFEVGWDRVAAANPAYGRHVEAEIARLGKSHPIVQTQYLLRAVTRGDRLLTVEQLAALKGDHPALDDPSERPEAWGKGGWVAGLDVAGADEEDPELALVSSTGSRDSTVLTIAFAEDVRAEGPGAGVVEPRLHVVHQYAWRNTPHRKLYPVVLSLIRDRWRCRRVCVDATGVGGGLAAFLGAALGPRIVEAFVYTAATKSQLGYDFLAALNNGRVTWWRPEGESADWYEFFDQAAAARYELRANMVMRWSVPEGQGHDDLLNAGALVVRAGPLAAHRGAVGRRPGAVR